MTLEFKKNTTETEIDLVSLFYLLLKNWRIILSFTLGLTILSLLYCLFATPIYETKALVQIEQKNGNSLLSDLNSMFSMSKPQADTEIEIIRSRMILGKTIKDLNLDMDVQSAYFPLVGALWANLFGPDNNQIALSYFSVPEEWYDEPLKLKVLNESQYILTRAGIVVLSGKVGQFASENGVSLLVSDIQAPKGALFAVKKQSELKIIEKLIKKLTIEEKGRDTGILELRLEGADPHLIKAILNKIAFNYLQQNVDRTSEEAAKSLMFLKDKLPEIKEQLDQSETAFNLYRQEHNSIDLTLEAKSILEVAVSLENQLNELIFKESEVSKLYTKEHPAYRALLEKRQVLLKEKAKLARKINSLPPTQQHILSLKRDVEANHEIYMALLAKQQELGIVKASAIGNVRIIDRAMTHPDPIKPKKILIILGSFLLAVVLSSAFVILRNALRRTIEHVEQIENLGINVYASIPLSNWQLKEDTLFQRNQIRQKQSQNTRSNQLVSIHCPTDLSVESLRSLRTSLYFAMMEAKNKVLAISGCTPEIGKTFITTNLSVVIADTDKKVLLIDSDMRKGYLHELMQVNMDKGGLSEFLAGQKDLSSVIYKFSSKTTLDFIPRGQIPPNPSELLMHSRLLELLNWASDNYDLILIDTPPVLAVTDACIISRYAGTVMIVVRYGHNSIKEVEFGLHRFEQNNINIKGVIFNGIVKDSDNYRYGYEYK